MSKVFARYFSKKVLMIIYTGRWWWHISALMPAVWVVFFRHCMRIRKKPFLIVWHAPHISILVCSFDQDCHNNPKSDHVLITGIIFIILVVCRVTNAANLADLQVTIFMYSALFFFIFFWVFTVVDLAKFDLTFSGNLGMLSRQIRSLSKFHYRATASGLISSVKLYPHQIKRYTL